MARVNRRNYYRILHVQPDAPAAVIRMAYRTLMQKLRLHPDLGGDGATASLINEAYAVLSDSQRRADYDAQNTARPARDVPQSAEESTVMSQTSANAALAPRGDPMHCAFCGATALLPTQDTASARCASCRSPLAPPPRDSHLAARRAFDRQPLAGSMEYFVRGSAHGPRPAALRDFSPGGVLVTTPEQLPSGSVLAVKSPLFDAVVRVVSCEEGAPGEVHAWHMRLEFLTLALNAPTGSFVATQV
ncbi:DnaJ domain-containing protein [Immundisolibacter sp.]|uniref:DnaJ domain-containing protein n=1 Tax=Immundisolibacter sp. TaxID=1934948 RepID=UPI00356AD13A